MAVGFSGGGAALTAGTAQGSSAAVRGRTASANTSGRYLRRADASALCRAVGRSPDTSYALRLAPAMLAFAPGTGLAFRG